MRRIWIVAHACLFWLLGTATVFAADPLQRGEGFYLAWWKLLCFWLVFVCFVRAADWVNHDCQEIGERYGMDPAIWNPAVIFGFLVIFLVGMLAIPLFAAGLPVAVLAYIIPLSVYIVNRNKRVMEDERVMTPKHLANWFSNLGKAHKKPLVTKLPHEEGPPVDYVAKGAASEQENQVNKISTHTSPGYLPSKELTARAMQSRADRVMMDFTRDAVTLRFEIDGVWQNAESSDRATGDAILAVFKTLANCNPAERRARQQGLFGITYKTQKLDAELQSQGTPTGERVVVKFVKGLAGLETLEQLGMREKMRERLAEYLKGKHGGGLILVSAMPTGGTGCCAISWPSRTSISGRRTSKTSKSIRSIRRPARRPTNCCPS
jgi:hypothetical protein